MLSMATAQCALARLPDLCDCASMLTFWLVLIFVGSEKCRLRSASQLGVYLVYRLSYSFDVLLYRPFDESKEKEVKAKVFLLQ